MFSEVIIAPDGAPENLPVVVSLRGLWIHQVMARRLKQRYPSGADASEGAAALGPSRWGMNAMGAGSQIQESCSSHCCCAFSCSESRCTKCLGCKASQRRNLGRVDPAGERALRSAFED